MTFVLTLRMPRGPLLGVANRVLLGNHPDVRYFYVSARYFPRKLSTMYLVIFILLLSCCKFYRTRINDFLLCYWCDRPLLAELLDHSGEKIFSCCFVLIGLEKCRFSLLQPSLLFVCCPLSASHVRECCVVIKLSSQLRGSSRRFLIGLCIFVQFCFVYSDINQTKYHFTLLQDLECQVYHLRQFPGALSRTSTSNVLKVPAYDRRSNPPMGLLRCTSILIVSLTLKQLSVTWAFHHC